MEEPRWQLVRYNPVDHPEIMYFAAPKPTQPAPGTLDEVDPELCTMFNGLDISLG